MAFEILKALLVGIIAALPVGPVLLLVVSNTTLRGKKAGFLAALGCVILDSSLAALSIFALGFIGAFIEKNEQLLMIIGSAILIVIGLSTLLSKIPEEKGLNDSKVSFVNCTLKTFLTGLSNPAAFAVMIALMASFGLSASEISAPVWTIILGVALGEVLYWSLIVAVILQRFHLSNKVKKIINILAGIGIIIFGLIMIAKVIFG